MSPDRLVYMANQIGKFFQSQGTDKARAGHRRAHPEILGSAHALRDHWRILTQEGRDWIRR